MDYAMKQAELAPDRGPGRLGYLERRLDEVNGRLQNAISRVETFGDALLGPMPTAPAVGGQPVSGAPQPSGQIDRLGERVEQAVDYMERLEAMIERLHDGV